MSKQITAPQKAKGVVHKVIADVAKGQAAVAWEQLAKQNKFFAQNRSQEAWVAHHWPKYLPVARATLTGMLGDPKRPQDQKDLIYDVLLRDGAINPKKMGNAPEAKKPFTLLKP